VNFERNANVIVGPNAVGKTSVLEALRLAKALLAPRIDNEAQHVLISLGAISPHNPARINLAALCGTSGSNVIIAATFELESAEIDGLDALVPQVAMDVVRASLGLNSAAAQLNIVQYLSSPAGAQAIINATNQIAAGIPAIKTTKSLNLELTIDAKAQNIRGTNQLHQLIFAALENRLAPHQTFFSYFPADRALPTGDVQIQIGGPDIAAQLQAHSMNPQQKYPRLKTTIVNSRFLSKVTELTSI